MVVSRFSRHSIDVTFSIEHVLFFSTLFKLGADFYDLTMTRQERTRARLRFEKYTILVLARKWQVEKEKLEIVGE